MRLRRHFVSCNDKYGKGSAPPNVISSEARNPYDVALADSISVDEGMTIPLGRPEQLPLFV